MPSKLIVTCIFFLALVINPAYLGCAASEKEPDFGEAEMLRVLDAANDTGRWEFTTNDARYELELSLMQVVGEDQLSAALAVPSALANTAHACGSRTFMQSASACLSVTTLAVEGELSLRALDDDGSDELLRAQPVEGSLIAYGDHLGEVTLELSFNDERPQLVLTADDTHNFELDWFMADSLGESAVDIAYAR